MNIPYSNNLDTWKLRREHHPHPRKKILFLTPKGTMLFIQGSKTRDATKNETISYHAEKDTKYVQVDCMVSIVFKRCRHRLHFIFSFAKAFQGPTNPQCWQIVAYYIPQLQKLDCPLTLACTCFPTWRILPQKKV